MKILCSMAIGLLLVAFAGSARGQSQEPSGPEAVSADRLQAAIDKLSDLDYDVRANASRTIRRTPGTQAVPALLRAVSEHADGYVRYRALVLLTAFNDPRTRDAIREALSSPNDRLRAVAYAYFERNPDPSVTPLLVAALEHEDAEFVRPSLVRALAAAAGDDPQIQSILVREANRGEDFFRSAVIEALGDYKATYAVDTLAHIATLDGPLLDDTALALGKIGARSSLSVLSGLQRTAPQPDQPFVAAAICLLNVNCDTHERYLRDTLAYAGEHSGFQEVARGAAAGLAALAVAGRASAAGALVDVGVPSQDPIRAPIALAFATVALRNMPLMIRLLSDRPGVSEPIALLAEGFDMLEEDLDKERFFAFVRRSYWAAPEGSTTRGLMQTLIGKLDF